METIKTLDNDPFKCAITTIGALPTSFIDSMSYYEMIAWLVNYIEKTLLPAINTDTNAINEIQDFLKTLNIEEYAQEIIDKLIEDGELYQTLTYDSGTQALTLTLTEGA